MNEFTHFLTGYLVGRAFKHKVDRFECLFVACCAFLPDLDSLINMFVPFEHGVWSHTFLVGSLFVLIFTIFTYLFNKPLLEKTITKFWRLFFMGFCGLASHFLLDAFTWHPGPCSIWLNPALLPPECICPGATCVSVDDLHHLFFWPLWNFPLHINTLFPYEWVTYDVRVWVEVIYTVIIAGVLVLRLLFKHQNFFGVFSPNRWWKHVSDASGSKMLQAPPRQFIWLFLVAFIFSFMYWGGSITDGIQAQTNPWIKTQIIFYGLFVLVNIIIGIYGLLLARDHPSVKMLLTAIGVVFIFLGIGRSFLMAFDFYSGSYAIAYRLGCFFDLMAFTVLDFIIERKIFTESKYCFTLFGVIVSVLQILAMGEILTNPVDIADYTHMYGIFPLLLLPFGLYLSIARKTTGDLRKNAWLIITGMVIYLVAQVGFSLLNTMGLLESVLQVNLKAFVSIIGSALCGYFLIAYSMGSLNKK